MLGWKSVIKGILRIYGAILVIGGAEMSDMSLANLARSFDEEENPDSIWKTEMPEVRSISSF
jgi:hypothetical protein